MGSVQNFFTSRDNNTDVDTYVGQLDRLWYNPDTNSIFVSNGVTPGGIPVALATGANAVFDNISANSITASLGILAIDGTTNITGSLSATGNISVAGNISPAADNKIGGIAPGPGVFISNEGILTIDSANLPVSFGNFTANNNILTIVNVNEDMILQTEGDAEIQLIGNVGFYKPDGIPPNVANRYAFFNNDGQVTFYIPVTDPAEGAIKIIGSASGNFTAPLNTGVMLQITGQNDDASRIYNDSIGGFAALVGRRLNGNISNPTPVLNDQELMRLTATGHNGNSFPTAAGQRITYRALGDQSLTNGGGAIEFWTTPLNSTTIGKIATVDTANGFNATKFTTAGTVSATGNVIGGNLTTAAQVVATGNISSGNIITVGIATATGNISTGNFFVGNGAFITGINAFGNVYANGVAITATSGSSVLTVTPGNNQVITPNNGTKTVVLAVSDNPTFVTASVTGNITAGNVSATNYTGLITRGVRDAGTIGDGGTLTINFATDSLVTCVWNNGLTISGSNYTAGRVVKVMATKGTGSGTDSITFNGFTASHISTGTTTQSYGADVTAIIEFISTSTAIGGVYVDV